MTLENLQTILVPQIEDALKTFINSIDFRSSSELGQMLRYHMGWEDDGPAKASTGKRLRPLIALLATGAFGDYPTKAMPAAVAVELLHNFTLIHDDIEDQSPMRHGRPTLWQKYGTAQAINAGDALFSIAQLSILDLAKTCNQHEHQREPQHPGEGKSNKTEPVSKISNVNSRYVKQSYFQQPVFFLRYNQS